MPDEARAEVVRLAKRYALVACISGRTGEDARRMVGVDGVRYVGAHGLELAPEADRWRDGFAPSLPASTGRSRTRGSRSRSTTAQAGDEDAALEYPRARWRSRRARPGSGPRFGRKVLEIRPPVHADKGTAVEQLLAEAGLRRALYAGDDTTDLDGFRALDGLEVGVRVAVSSDEAPERSRRAARTSSSTRPRSSLTLLRRALAPDCQNLAEGGDRRAPRQVLVRCSRQLLAGSPRSWTAVMPTRSAPASSSLAPSPTKRRLAGLDAQPLARDLVDPRIRFRDARRRTRRRDRRSARRTASRPRLRGHLASRR